MFHLPVPYVHSICLTCLLSFLLSCLSISICPVCMFNLPVPYVHSMCLTCILSFPTCRPLWTTSSVLPIYLYPSVLSNCPPCLSHLSVYLAHISTLSPSALSIWPIPHGCPSVLSPCRPLSD
jgi:hypothetical protein